MRRPNHVLAVIDFSEAADEALRQAHGVARLTSATLSVLHVVPDFLRASPLFPDGSPDDLTVEVELEKRALDDVAARVKEVLGTLQEEVQTAVRVGAIDASVMQYAEEHGVDVVVTGATGRTGLSRLLLGSNAERIVRYAHCSVLVARASEPTGRVLAATDLSEAATEPVERAKAEAQLRGARLDLVYVVDSRSFDGPVPGLPGSFGAYGAEERLAELREAATARLQQIGGPDATVHVAIGAPRRAIVATADAVKADLIVVGTHGRTGLARIALGSVAETVVRDASCSVLVVRNIVPRPPPAGNFE